MTRPNCFTGREWSSLNPSETKMKWILLNCYHCNSMIKNLWFLMHWIYKKQLLETLSRRFDKKHLLETRPMCGTFFLIGIYLFYLVYLSHGSPLFGVEITYSSQVQEKINKSWINLRSWFFSLSYVWDCQWKSTRSKQWGRPKPALVVYCKKYTLVHSGSVRIRSEILTAWTCCLHLKPSNFNTLSYITMCWLFPAHVYFASCAKNLCAMK